MFPEGLTVMPAEENEFLDLMDSGESVITGIVWEPSKRFSVGVGGVTVVSGAGWLVWRGVAGIGLLLGGFSEDGGFSSVTDFSSLTSVRIGAGIGGTVSALA